MAICGYVGECCMQGRHTNAFRYQKLLGPQLPFKPFRKKALSIVVAIFSEVRVCFKNLK